MNDFLKQTLKSIEKLYRHRAGSRKSCEPREKEIQGDRKQTKTNAERRKSHHAREMILSFSAAVIFIDLTAATKTCHKKCQNVPLRVEFCGELKVNRPIKLDGHQMKTQEKAKPIGRHIGEIIFYYHSQTERVCGLLWDFLLLFKPIFLFMGPSLRLRGSLWKQRSKQCITIN